MHTEIKVRPIERAGARAAVTAAIVAVTLVVALFVGFGGGLGGGLLFAGGAEQELVKEVVVRSGDTLWSLAVQHGPSRRDVRETIDRIRSLNQLESANLRPGMRLMIPTQ